MAAKTDVISTPTRRRQGILCIEGSWIGTLEGKASIEAALRCAESMGLADVIHKEVVSRADIQHYVDLWLGTRGQKLPAYRLGMFAFHGNRHGLSLPDGDTLSLDDLADVIGNRAYNRVIYVGGCNVLALPESDLTRFCVRTRARGLVGYTKAVPLLETAAFEMVLIEQLLGFANFKSTYTRLRRQHPEWTQRLGLRMAHATWASDRKITE